METADRDREQYEDIVEKIRELNNSDILCIFQIPIMRELMSFIARHAWT
jgi:hypothetical protein